MPDRLDRSPVPVDACNLAAAFAALGDRTTLLLLRSALYGVTRFDDLVADTRQPRSVVASRLKELVARGLLCGEAYREPGARTRQQYRLTSMGEALLLPFMAMTMWGDRWLGDGDVPMTLHRREDGAQLTLGLVDDEGRAVPLDAVERRYRDSPQ